MKFVFQWTVTLDNYMQVDKSNILCHIKLPYGRKYWFILEVITDNWTQKFEPHGGQISKP